MEKVHTGNTSLNLKEKVHMSVYLEFEKYDKIT